MGCRSAANTRVAREGSSDRQREKNDPTNTTAAQQQQQLSARLSLDHLVDTDLAATSQLAVVKRKSLGIGETSDEEEETDKNKTEEAKKHENDSNVVGVIARLFANKIFVIDKSNEIYCNQRNLISGSSEVNYKRIYNNNNNINNNSNLLVLGKKSRALSSSAAGLLFSRARSSPPVISSSGVGSTTINSNEENIRR